jgi:hypothetical protein
LGHDSQISLAFRAVFSLYAVTGRHSTCGIHIEDAGDNPAAFHRGGVWKEAL